MSYPRNGSHNIYVNKGASGGGSGGGVTPVAISSPQVGPTSVGGTGTFTGKLAYAGIQFGGIAHVELIGRIELSSFAPGTNTYVGFLPANTVPQLYYVDGQTQSVSCPIDIQVQTDGTVIVSATPNFAGGFFNFQLTIPLALA